MKFATKAIHAGQEPDPTTGAIMTPIYQTSTYVQSIERDEKYKSFTYARGKNPTRNALEQNIAALENCKHGLCFSSGMGAVDAVVKLLQPGDEVISTNDLYGGTYRLFIKVYEKFGIKFKFVPMGDLAAIEAAITPATKLLWVETPTNPLLNIIDIEGVVAIGKKANALVVVDNTFSSPYLQNPADMGADIVMHSVTKYLSGHSDVIMGFLGTNNDDLHAQLAFILNSTGTNPGPQDSFLVLRGTKTLHLRMERHCENAAKIANYLNNHPKVDKVYYPGLPTHPGHEIAKKQMRGFGGMVSFTLKNDSVDEALRVMKSTHLFSLAESLGGVESLIGHPATMTHGAIPREERIKNGLSDSLIRMSVGIEDIDDLIEDLKNAIG